MIGLLLNDVLNIRKQAIWYLAMILIFCIASVVMKNEAFSGAIGLTVGISIPITAMAYEERDGWQKFVVASGVRVQTIVGEKFLLGLLFSAIGWIGNAVAFLCLREEGAALSALIGAICMQIIALAAVLPVVFKYGAERGRVYSIAVVVLAVIVLIACMTAFQDAVSGSVALLVAGMVVAIASVLLSFRASVKIYAKKEF